MNSNIETGSRISFVPYTTVTIPVGAGGGASYTDVDCSAVGTDTTRLHVCVVRRAAVLGYAGIRAHGSTVDSKAYIQLSGTFLSKTDTAGHCDMWHDAAGGDEINYQFIGYIKMP